MDIYILIFPFYVDFFLVFFISKNYAKSKTGLLYQYLHVCDFLINIFTFYWEIENDTVYTNDYISKIAFRMNYCIYC